MKIKTKFTVSNVLMLIIPLTIIGITTACFLVMFAVRFPSSREMYTKLSLLDPANMIAVLGEFFQHNPDAGLYVFIWAVLSVAVLAVTVTVITGSLSRSIRKPIDELKAAAENIREGNLDFELLGNEYAEFDELCRCFDDMRTALKSSREREAQLRSERSMLLANISHDLKTPITSIKGYIEGIRDGIADTPEKLERYLDTIYTKAVILDDMVSNLSVYSKLELSKLRFEFEKGSVNDFLSDVLAEYRLDLEKHGMELTTEFCEEDTTVLIDYEQMLRVITNILDNSVKYKKEGRGLIRVSTKTENGGVIIRIDDDGIGISADELESVFEEFYRADASRNPNIKGSGLGLGIAKQIITAHKGKIWLKQGENGLGTTAMIYLPLWNR